MLYCHLIDNPDVKKKAFGSFTDPEILWVVNDLESKFWIQDFLQEQRGPIIQTDLVVRASELWQKLLLLMDPSWQPLPTHFSEFLIEKWMGQILKQVPLKVSSKDCSRAYQTIGQILPLLGHFQSEDIMEQWFNEQEEAKERWADWYLLAKALWQAFLEKKVIPLEWMKGVLINEELPSLSSSPIVVDLGLDIDDIESELFLNLSRQQDVHIIVPKSQESTEVYDSLISRAQVSRYDSDTFSGQKTFKKLPSTLAEVKEAVFWVRKWLDQGMPAKDIAIISPQIENYWPTLYEHLLVEGIAVEKDKMTPLSQIPIYQDWLSHLRMASKKMQWGDAEQMLFGKSEVPTLAYRKFQSLFSNIYTVDDYARSAEVKEEIPETIDSEQAFSLSDFFATTMSYVPQKHWPEFEKVLQDLDGIYELNETLPFKKWIEFFEYYFSRTETLIEPAAKQGVMVLSLTACHNPSIQKAVILGLSESHLLEKHNTALHWNDIESIKLNFGFNLPHADRLQLVEHLHWFDKKNISEKVYTHGETDFAGQFQSPSMFWLQGALENNCSIDLTSPGITRWDEISKSSVKQDLPLTEEEQKRTMLWLERDSGLQPYEKVPYASLTLSASSFEEYFKCPFRLFAQKGLHLRQDPFVDLDLDAMSRGRLMHRICEVIVSKKSWSMTEPELLDLVDQARQDIEMQVYTEEVWQFLRPYYMKAARAFIDFEVQWRHDHPNTETLAVEQKLRTHIRVEDQDLVFNSHEGIPFSGTIDRIDINDKGQVAIIDYKSSDSGLTMFGSWISKGKIQLALYTLALMEGVLHDKPYDVVGAFYFVLKTMDRKFGFAMNEASADFIDPKKEDRAKVTEMLDEAKALIIKMIEELQQGVIEARPSPVDKNLCDKCDWNQLCRYPALNL